MTRCLRSLLVLLCLLPVAMAPAFADERILDYDVEIDVVADGSLEVTEHITVRAEGRQIRRGIYRDFPTRYRDRVGNNVVVDLRVLGLERGGEAEPWFTERISNGIRINFGDDSFLPRYPEVYRYTLRYRTTRQLGFFADHDELYFNAIGTGWIFPIDAGSVRVRLPEPVPVERMSVEAYTGPQGAQGRNYEASVDSPGLASWRLTAPLRPREGFTIVLGFPKGLVPEPTQAERAGWLLKDNRGVLAALIGFAILVLFCVVRWRRIGRDPASGVIIARYEPPAGRSPAELRYLRRRNYDNRCFTADLLDAAVAGHVRIRRDERRWRSDDWSLERLADAAGARPVGATVTALFGGLFTGARQRVLELKKSNASRLQAARRAHAAELDRRLHGSHFRRNGGSVAIGFAIAIITALLSFPVAQGGGVFLIVLICVAMFAVLVAFGILIQAPTVEGRRLLDEAEGLRLYLSVAERDELKNLPGPEQPPALDAERYEQLLPYAVALDVEDAWTKKFTLAAGAAAAAAATAGIAWYRGGGSNDLGSLARSVSTNLSSSIASASTPPGSSSGGGGGGSSGGGGGGGGGGGR